MVGLVIALVVWIVGIPIAYKFWIGKWEDHTNFDKLYFSVIWPLVLILAGIHAVNKRK
jgi:hypothetical protein